MELQGGQVKARLLPGVAAAVQLDQLERRQPRSSLLLLLTCTMQPRHASVGARV
jgi:hypothetical protein